MSEGGPLRMVLAYDGTDYSGWQIQPDRRTVQGLVRGRLTQMAGEPVALHGAGRTDAGVHASGQVAHFHPPRDLPTDAWQKGLNAMLPEDIRILGVEQAPVGFHARKSARDKVYRYQIHQGEVCPPFQVRYCHHEPRPLDVEAMRKGADFLMGEHDFASFQASGSSVKTTVRRVIRLDIQPERSLLEIRVRGTGFLRAMVRNMVGTLLEVGIGARDSGWVGEVLEARDRDAAGPTAPARGLFLVQVHYPPDEEIAATAGGESDGPTQDEADEEVGG